METNNAVLNMIIEKKDKLKKELAVSRKEQRKLRNKLQHMKPKWDMNLYEFSANKWKVKDVREELDSLECKIATMNVQIETIDDILMRAGVRVDEQNGANERLFRKSN